MAKSAAEHSKAYRERQRAKRLAPAAVARSDKGREKAEQAQGVSGPARPGRPAGEPRAKSVGEAVDRIKKTAEVATAAAPVKDVRPPTSGEIAMIRQFMDMGLAPLNELENDFTALGFIGPDVPPALAKTGSLGASPKEVDNLAMCYAGTMVNFTPSFMLYLYPIGAIFGTLGFVGSRLMVLFRINQAVKAAEKRELEAAELRRQGKHAPANANGVVTPMPAPTQPAGRN